MQSVLLFIVPPVHNADDETGRDREEEMNEGRKVRNKEEKKKERIERGGKEMKYDRKEGRYKEMSRRVSE